MLFNPTKCYKMSVYQSRSAVLKDYTLCNQTLVAVQPHPCLGTLLSSDLRWNPHMDKIAKNFHICEKEIVRLLRGKYHFSGHI